MATKIRGSGIMFLKANRNENCFHLPRNVHHTQQYKKLAKVIMKIVNDNEELTTVLRAIAKRSKKACILETHFK